MTQVQKAQAAARKARTVEQTAWAVWDRTETADDQRAWVAAADAAERAEAAVDRAEVQQDRDEDRQTDWWVAACAA